MDADSFVALHCPSFEALDVAVHGEEVGSCLNCVVEDEDVSALVKVDELVVVGEDVLDSRIVAARVQDEVGHVQGAGCEEGVYHVHVQVVVTVDADQKPVDVDKMVDDQQKVDDRRQMVDAEPQIDPEMRVEDGSCDAHSTLAVDGETGHGTGHLVAAPVDGAMKLVAVAAAVDGQNYHRILQNVFCCWHH